MGGKRSVDARSVRKEHGRSGGIAYACVTTMTEPY